MSLTCAVCPSTRVTHTVETETGLKALCDPCYAAVADHAQDELRAEHAIQRHTARRSGVQF